MQSLDSHWASAGTGEVPEINSFPPSLSWILPEHGLSHSVMLVDHVLLYKEVLLSFITAQ